MTAEDDVLLQAGINRAAHLVSAVYSEAENIVITLSARDLQPEVRGIA